MLARAFFSATVMAAATRHGEPPAAAADATKECLGLGAQRTSRLETETNELVTKYDVAP